MPAARLLHDERVQNHTAGSALACGAIVTVDAQTAGVVLPLQGIANGAVGSVAIRGLYAVTKRSADVWAAGDQILWSHSNSFATNKTANQGASWVKLGRAQAAAGSGVVLANVYLNELAVNNLS
jgi:predicted RecA/RadA family phage recombinase